MTKPRNRLDLFDGSAVADRRITFAVMALASLAALLITPLTTPEQWVGWLPSTVSASEAAAAWAPCLLGGCAAWVSGQSRAHGMREWASSSSRGPAGRIAPALLLVSGVAVATQALAVVVLGLITVRFGAAQHMVGLDLLVSVPTLTAYLLTWIAVGALLGRVAPRELALPVSVLLPYATYAVMSLYLSDTPLGALALGDGRSYDYVRPTESLVLTRAVFWALLAGALWAWLLQRRRTGRALRWGASAAAALALFQGVAIVDLPQAGRPACAGSAPLICLDRSHASALPRYRTAVDELWPSVPAALRPGVVGSDAGVVPTSAGAVLIAPPVAGFTEPSRLVDNTMFAARFGDALFLGPCTTAGGDPAGALTLVVWWRLAHGISLTTPAYAGDAVPADADPGYADHLAAAKAFAQGGEPARQAWFSEHADQVRACSAPVAVLS